MCESLLHTRWQRPSKERPPAWLLWLLGTHSTSMMNGHVAMNGQHCYCSHQIYKSPKMVLPASLFLSLVKGNSWSTLLLRAVISLARSPTNCKSMAAQLRDVGRQRSSAASMSTHLVLPSLAQFSRALAFFCWESQVDGCSCLQRLLSHSVLWHTKTEWVKTKKERVKGLLFSAVSLPFHPNKLRLD